MRATFGIAVANPKGRLRHPQSPIRVWIFFSDTVSYASEVSLQIQVQGIWHFNRKL